MLPSAVREEAVVATRDKLGAICERHAEGEPERLPVSEDLGPDISARSGHDVRPVDLVSDLEIVHCARPAVAQQNARVA